MFVSFIITAARTRNIFSDAQWEITVINIWWCCCYNKWTHKWGYQTQYIQLGDWTDWTGATAYHAHRCHHAGNDLNILDDSLTENFIMDALQSGFRTQHNTESTLLKVTNGILLSIDSGKGVALMLLDLIADFDITDHFNWMPKILFRNKQSCPSVVFLLFAGQNMCCKHQ